MSSKHAEVDPKTTATEKTIIGLDISDVSCQYAREDIGIPVIRGDLENPLPFRKESFDLIILADVLEHLTNDRQLLTQAFDCLKLHGMVIVTVPAYSHMWSLWDERLHHKRRYSLADLKEKVATAGLAITKATYFHMLLYPFVYLYRKILHLHKIHSSGKSDFSVSSNKLLFRMALCYYSFERFLLKRVPLPFGLSIFVTGIKQNTT